MKNFTKNRWLSPSSWMGLTAIIMTIMAFSPQMVTAQCTWSTVTYGTGSAPSIGNNVNITTCAYAGERSTINGVVSGETYVVSYSGNAAPIVTIFNSSQVVVASGASPVTFTAAAGGTFYSQGNTTGCGTATGCNTVNWSNTTTISCPWPDTLVASALTISSATLGWSEMGSATNWAVEWGPSGFAQGTGTMVAVSTTPSTALATLNSGFDYDYYVAAICTGADTSAWSSGSFTTVCVGVSSFSENFDGVTAPANPSCWSNLYFLSNTFGYVRTYNSSSNANSGNNSIRFYNSNDINPVWMMISPALSNLSSGTHQTVFYAKDADANDIIVGTMSDNTDTATFTPYDTITTTSTYQEYIVSFAGYSGTDTYIAYRSVPGATYDYTYIDDISWEMIPSCPKPQAFAISTITSVGATLAWTEMGSATTWDVEYGPLNYTLGGTDGTMVTAGSNPFVLTGLSALNDYDVYVRSDCGAGDSSVWIGPISFTTSCLGPLSGTYTMDPSIAVSTTNFVSMADFVQAVDICGLGGAVVLNVTSSSDTLVGPWDFAVISGASATNTLTINGNNNLVHKNPSSNHFVRLEGTKYLSINGFNFVNQTPNSNMFGIQMKNGCDSIAISNNTIDVGMGYTSSASGGIVASNSTTSATSGGNNANNVLITNNEIIGGYYGIRINGTGSTNRTSGHSITNNTIHDFYYYGTYLNYVDSVFVNGNDYSRNTRSNGGYFYGIYANYASKCSIKGNEIHDVGVTTTNVYGIQLRYSSNAVGSESEIVNNAMHNISGSGSGYGIYLYGTKSYINVYHNTIDLETKGTSSKYAIYNTSTTANVNVKNNVVSMHGAGTGSSYGLYYSTSAATLLTDYNNVYVNSSGTNYYGRWSSNRLTLAAFQTASSQAANSSAVDPVFANIAGGNFSPLSMTIDNMGALVGVTTDIDGVTRSASTPDIGAIEFTGIPGDLEMTDAMLSQVGQCYGSADTAFAMVTNLLGSTVDFSTDPLTIVWNVTGPINTTDSLTVNSGTLAVGSNSIFSISTIDMSIPGDYDLSVYIKPNTGNASSLNDTLWNVYTETVTPILAVSPDSVTVTSPFDMPTLSTASPLYPGANPFITEVSQYAYSTINGYPVGGVPSFMGSNTDYVEITGIPGSDLDGMTLEIWNSSSMSSSFTFSSGTVIGPNGTAIISTYSGVTSAANFYYTAMSYSMSSGTASGRILRDGSGNIIDAVGYGAFIFPASSGVTASDWTGTTASTSTTWGTHLAGADVNSSTGWSVTNTANGPRQTPGALNSGVTVPSAPIVAGIVWDSAGTTVGTTPNIDAGPFTTTGVYPYYVTFTNACGTFADTSIVTVDLTNATMSASTNVSCNAGDNGTATVTAGGGDAPYTYLWSNGDIADMADSLMAGTYTVTVYDANMWPATATVTITEPTAITATTSTTPSTCGVPSGSATVASTGGTGAHTYLWSTGATTATATGLVGGTYTVTVTDSNMCTDMYSATVSDIGAPAITIVVDNIATCFGDSTGQVTASGTGGSTPYAFAWSSGGTAATETGLPMGVYTVVLTDASGCVSNGTVTMTQNPALLAVVTGSTDPLCNGDATGTASSIAGGGVAPYSYLWSNGDAMANASALAAGSHSVVVTDAVGCMQTANVNISQPNQLGGVFVNVMDVACNGGSTGSAGILATGGTAPYMYSWSNGNTGTNATSLSSGYVAVTVTDANNCSMMDSVSVAEPTALVASTTGATDALCNGGNTGTATAMAAGGTMPYVYAWSNGAGGTLATGLMAGTYTVSVSDANNCASTDTIVVGQPATAVSVAVTSTNASCNGISDGGATAIGAGGTAGYTYSWSNGSSTGAITGLAAGSYAVTATDANGCMSSSSASVTEPTMLMASATSTDVTCNGGNDGQATAMGSGGTSPYSYVWNNGPTTGLNDTVMAGMYSAVVTDANGCTASTSATITEPMPVVVNLGADATICSADVFTLDAGAGFASYAWDDASTMQTRDIDAAVAGPGAATYFVSVLTAAGCEGMDTITVTVADPVTTSIIINGSSTICQYESTSMDAGPGFASYTWSNTSNSQTINIYAASQTVGMNTFTVTVTDANGCEGIAMETVEVYPEVVFNLGADTTVWQNAIFTIEADSGYASYTWNTGATTQNLDVTTAGTYSVVVTDSLTGCAGSDEMVVDFVLSVDGASAAQLKLYPNPAVDYINLEFSNFVQQGTVEIQILSITGQLVRTVNVDVSASNGTSLIDVSKLAVGTYMVTFDYEGQKVVKQFTIK